MDLESASSPGEPDIPRAYILARSRGDQSLPRELRIAWSDIGRPERCPSPWRSGVATSSEGSSTKASIRIRCVSLLR